MLIFRVLSTWKCGFIYFFFLHKLSGGSGGNGPIIHLSERGLGISELYAWLTSPPDDFSFQWGEGKRLIWHEHHLMPPLVWFGEGIHCSWFSSRSNSGSAGRDSEQKASYINSPCKRVLNVHASSHMQAHGEATLCFRYTLYGFLLMFQNKVNFYGECFMAGFLLCVRQIRGGGDGWGRGWRSRAGLLGNHSSCSFICRCLSGRSSIQLPVLLQRIVFKKKKRLRAAISLAMSSSSRGGLRADGGGGNHSVSKLVFLGWLLSNFSSPSPGSPSVSWQ